ncbi:MAG: type II secretion system GspH family protein [Clostridium sp.]|nr:type II secretion system GspH family protein [Clostridium sp.]
MCKKVNRNRGFTLVELLISMALLSIIMLMVVQFMSTTAGANKKAQHNLKAQSEANEVMQNITDSIMQANYVRVVTAEDTAYTISKSDGNRKDSLTSSDAVTADLTQDKAAKVNYDFVPDNYGNYVRNTVSSPDERKVIIDMDTYQLVGQKKDTLYPLTGDLEEKVDVRSFRVLKQDISGVDTYIYVKPAYIYLEHAVSEVLADGTIKEKVANVIYRFDYDNNAIYMWRISDESAVDRNTTDRFANAKAVVDSLSDDNGRLTNHMVDFYLSADAEGNALLTDALFEIKGYMFNSANTVNFRNSSVLTVRPQNSYKKADTGGSGGTGGGSGTGDSGDEESTPE